MKPLDIAGFKVVKAGIKFTIAPPFSVVDLISHMERNDAYIFWLQPETGGVDQQEACIHVNGRYYTLNGKLEKAIFRNVRLTRDFRNYEHLVDGTKKLVIPKRLMNEKLRTSKRVSLHGCVCVYVCMCVCVYV